MQAEMKEDYQAWLARNNVTGGDSLFERVWNDAYAAAWDRQEKLKTESGNVVPPEQKASLMRAAVVMKSAAKQLSSSEDCSGLPALLLEEAAIINRARSTPPPAPVTNAPPSAGEALAMAVACGRSARFDFRIPGTSQSHPVECAVLEAVDVLKLYGEFAKMFGNNPNS